MIKMRGRSQRRKREREKERLSGLYLETEFGEERGAGGWDPPPHRTQESRAAVKHSGARFLSASATRACVDQASDSSMLASERPLALHLCDG